MDVSEMCQPKRKSGVVIRKGDSKGLMTLVELGASAFLLQTIHFREGNLTHIPAGMPKMITGLECISCFDKLEEPDVMRGCRVDQALVYAPGQVNISVRTTDGPFKSIAESFRETFGEKRLFTGAGDLTGNGNDRAIFMFHKNTMKPGRKVLRYIEYAAQNHAEELKELAVADKPNAKFALNKENAYAWDIECDVNELSFPLFLQAVMVYRSMQLENPIDPRSFDNATHQFSRISEEDVYRAALSMKIIDDTDDVGDYFVYTVCGKYNWKFITPLLTCLFIIIALGIASMIVSPRAQAVPMPYNSRSWFEHSLGTARMCRDVQDAASSSGYFESVFEEIVLVPDRPGSDSHHVVFRSRPRGRHEENQDIGNVERDPYGMAYQASPYKPFDEPFEEPVG